MNLTLITHLVVALAAAAGAWVFQDARMEAAVAEVRLEQTNERLGAVSQARADERAITKTYQGALNAARDREALLRTELDHLHSVSDGLRDQNAEAARRLAAAPPPPSLSTPLPSEPYSKTAAQRTQGWSKKLKGTRVMSEPFAKPGQ